MDYIKLGRTELETSVMGLGCGGHSRLGQSYGNTKEQSIRVIKHALELGINFIDTAEAYHTEAIVGDALANEDRSNVILSTKKSIRADEQLITAEQIIAGLENSLRELKTEYVDFYHLHGVSPMDYAYVVEEGVPALQKLKEQGKLRYLGITEGFASDTVHQMLCQAVEDDCWDVMMVGFNLLNQSARDYVLPTAIRKDIGILVMFAVRRALRSDQNLSEMMDYLIDQKLIDQRYAHPHPLEFLLAGGAENLQDAAYRFCRYEPGVHVTLCGTGNIKHLEDNVASILRPPLPETVCERLRQMFRAVNSVSGN